MQLKNTNNTYGYIAILLHWIMAVLIIALLILGLYMTNLPIGLQKLKLYGWHKELGVLALALVLIRILWRLTNITPSLRPLLPLWEAIAARCTHWIFYLLMLALPITGWIMSSAAGLPVSFFGLFVLPDIISSNETVRMLFQQIHEWLGYAIIGFICLHVAAALKHHFINKDDIMRRMLP
jgi:cytochrome b561